MIQYGFIAAWRRAMRRHQGVPADRGRDSLARLVGGEVWWAARQVAHSPAVALGLVGGTASTLAVLGRAAPGPIVGPPWRLVLAIAAGLAVAAALRRIRTANASSGRADGDDPDAPLLGAVVLSGAGVALLLTVWLLAWVVDGAT